MRNEQQDVDEECEKSDEQGRESEDEEGEEVSRGMTGAMEVGGDGEAEADEGEEGSDGVDDEDRGQTISGRSGERPVLVGVVAGEEAICIACSVCYRGKDD